MEENLNNPQVVAEAQVEMQSQSQVQNENNVLVTETKKPAEKSEVMLLVSLVGMFIAFSLSSQDVSGMGIFFLIGNLLSILIAIVIFLPYIDYSISKLTSLTERDEKKLVAYGSLATVAIFGVVFVVTFLQIIASANRSGSMQGIIFGVIASVFTIIGVNLYSERYNLGINIKLPEKKK